MFIGKVNIFRVDGCILHEVAAKVRGLFGHPLPDTITAIVVNPPERKLAKRTSVQCTEVRFASFLSGGIITAIVKILNAD